jgi:hypothetical protein
MIILITLFILFIILAAICNAIMDLITPLDRLAKFGFYWSKTAMEMAKPKDLIYQIFPLDWWHRSKLLMNIFIGCACSCLLPLGYILRCENISVILVWITSISCTPVFFFAFSFTFEFFYSKYRKL